MYISRNSGSPSFGVFILFGLKVFQHIMLTDGIYMHIVYFSELVEDHF